MDSTPSQNTDVSTKKEHWTFLSNHAHVLICLNQNPEMRLRDVALKVGITERAVQKIVKDLEGGEVISKQREGRRNQYTIHGDVKLRHPVESHRKIGHLLSVLQ